MTEGGGVTTLTEMTGEVVRLGTTKVVVPATIVDVAVAVVGAASMVVVYTTV